MLHQSSYKIYNLHQTNTDEKHSKFKELHFKKKNFWPPHSLLSHLVDIRQYVKVIRFEQITAFSPHTDCTSKIFILPYITYILLYLPSLSTDVKTT